MGLIVEYNDQELWSPSLRVGNLFLEQVKALEQFSGLESGIESNVADILEVNGSTLKEFVANMLRALETTNNGPLIALATGCTEILVALNARITGEWPEVSERLNPLVLNAKTVLLSLSK